MPSYARCSSKTFRTRRSQETRSIGGGVRTTVAIDEEGLPTMAVAIDADGDIQPESSFKRRRRHEREVDTHALRDAKGRILSFLTNSSEAFDPQSFSTTDRSFCDALAEETWHDVVESYQQDTEKVVVDDIGVALQQVARRYHRYIGIVNALGASGSILSDCLAVENANWISRHATRIAQQIHRDLEEGKGESLCRDALIHLRQADLWREFVCDAAHHLVETHIQLLGQGSFDEGDEGGSDDGHHNDAGGARFDQAALPQFSAWLSSALLPVLSSWAPSRLETLASQLDYEGYTALGRLRARQLFDIISDFPASSPALQDLVACAEEVVDLKPYISSQLNKALHTRLLHPGASTQDIIQFYTHLIRSLRFVDPSGVILSHVIGPVRTYLRARADTVPVIVASLLGQAGEFTLLRDLMRETTSTLGSGNGVSKNLGDTSVTLYDEADDAEIVDIAAMDESKRLIFIPPPDEDYAPRPTDAGPDFRQSRKSDVVAIVASIFEDEQGFIAALERSCADQFLRVRGYDTSSEYETNENLKKRFGDTWLSRCDVMLNDIKKSQRYDRSIHRSLTTSGEELPDSVTNGNVIHFLHPLILSRQFWPALKAEDAPPTAMFPGRAQGPGSAAGAPSLMFSMPSKAVTGRRKASVHRSASLHSPLPASTHAADATIAAATTATEMATADLQMPGQFGAALEQYGAQFAKHVNGRRVRWLAGRGHVRVRLAMDDGRLIEEDVLPIQAAVIELAATASAQAKRDAMDDVGQQLGVLLLADAAAQLRIDTRYVSDALSFWTARNVLQESAPGSYSVVEQSVM